MNLYLWFGLMLTLSVLWLVWFLYRPLKTNTLNLEKSNIALGRQKQKELEQDLQGDLIDDQLFEQAKDEIAQTLSIEITQPNSVVNTNQPSVSIGLVVLIVVLLSGACVLVYQSLSSHNMATTKAQQVPTLEESIVKIKQRVAEKPDDAKAWQMLGLVSFETGDIKTSLAAYEQAYQLDAKNVTLLVEYASTIAIAQNNQFTGRVSTLVREALEIDPNDPNALHLAGWVAVSAQQFDVAQKLWQKTLSILPKGSMESTALQHRLAELSKILTNTPSVKNTSKKHQVRIEITLSERLRLAQYQNHYLMVYVKAAQGRSMPIAIQKMKLKDFKGVVVLTDENSVMPTQKLSQSGKVLAVVRLSQSGAAMRQVNDIEVVSQVIDIKDNPSVKLKL